MKKRGIFFKSARAQVWVETVIYTLIALVMIGLVLSFARPKIAELQDKAILEQSVSMMKEINNILLDLSQGGSGNRRKAELSLNKGSLIVDGTEDTITFRMEESNYDYSEPGEPVEDGNIAILTESTGDTSTVTMTLDYTGIYNIVYQDTGEKKTISASSVPYNLYITNEGVPEGGGNTVMNFELN
jgi:type II secretory pathway pseudopilin PulG